MSWRAWTVVWILTAACHGQTPAEGSLTGILEDARQIALNYSKALPNFICTEVVHRYEAHGPTGPFRTVDTLTLQLTYFQLRENYKLVARNDRPTKQKLESVGGAFSQGEFGSKLLLIFHPASKASFAFREWTEIGTRRVAAYTYRVERADSHFELRVATNSMVVGYHGTVFIDEAAHRVLRIEEEVDVPDGFPVQYARNSGDYEFVDVGGQQYLLPTRSESLSADLPPGYARKIRTVGPELALNQQVRYRNVIEFRDYRKYAAESTLTFDAPGPPK